MLSHSGTAGLTARCSAGPTTQQVLPGRLHGPAPSLPHNQQVLPGQDHSPPASLPDQRQILLSGPQDNTKIPELSHSRQAGCWGGLLPSWAVWWSAGGLQPPGTAR